MIFDNEGIAADCGGNNSRSDVQTIEELVGSIDESDTGVGQAIEELVGSIDAADTGVGVLGADGGGNNSV